MGRRAAHLMWAVAVAAAPWAYGGAPEPVRWAFVAVCAVLCALTAPAVPWTLVPLLALPGLQLAWSDAPGQTLDAGLAFAGCLLAIPAAWELYSDPGRQKQIVVLGVLAVCAQAAFGVAQSILTPGSLYGQRSPWVTTPFGSFVNHNHFATLATAAAFLAVGLAWQSFRRRRALTPVSVGWGGAAIALVIAQLASGSRGGILALVAASIFLVVLILRARTKALLLASAVLAAGGVGLVLLVPTARDRLAVLTAGPDGSVSQRIDGARATLRLAAANPLAGSGLGSLVDAVTPYKHTQVNLQHADSDVLEYTAETGLLGWVVLAVAGLPVVRRVRSNLETPRGPLVAGAGAAAVAILAHAFFDYSLRLPAITLVFVTCVGVAAADPRSGGRSRTMPVVLGAMMGLAALHRAGVAWDLAEIADGSQRRLALLSSITARAPWVAEGWRERGATRARLAAGPLREMHLAQAAADYERVLTLRPAWGEGWYERAWIEAARGRRETAVASLQRAGALDPANAQLAFASAELTLRLRGPAEAVEVLNDLAAAARDVPRERIVTRGRLLTVDPGLLRRLEDSRSEPR